MRVAVFINKNAGFAKAGLIKEKIKQSLFRCELSFHLPETVIEMQKAVLQEAQNNVNFLIICGGDGTLNVALQPLMIHRKSLPKIPPLCIVSVGTANDLATELNLSKKVDRAVRAILEGKIKEIDVIEVTSLGCNKYMLTNGGLGIPAVTAEKANVFRSWMIQAADCPYTHFYWRPFLKLGVKTIKKFGSKIYQAILIEGLIQWQKNKDWELEITLSKNRVFKTKAPFVLVNNQAKLAGHFTTAPLTDNADGLMNILLVESSNFALLVHRILQIKSGRIPEWKDTPSFEISEAKIKTVNDKTLLTVFGDGEILLTGVPEVEFRCLHKVISLVKNSEEI